MSNGTTKWIFDSEESTRLFYFEDLYVGANLLARSQQHTMKAELTVRIDLKLRILRFPSSAGDVTQLLSGIRTHLGHFEAHSEIKAQVTRLQAPFLPDRKSYCVCPLSVTLTSPLLC